MCENPEVKIMTECESKTFKACITCHALIETSAKFCCFCGIEQKHNEITNHFTICPSCKAEIDREEAKFCPICGYHIITPIPAQAQLVQEIAPVQIVPSTQANAPILVSRHGKHQRPPRKVDRISAGVFAMLLGTFGAHWFYLGKPGLGVLCILTFWTGIPTIAGLVFGIRSLVADDETFKTKIMW